MVIDKQCSSNSQNDLGIMNLITESTILMSLPGSMLSPPQNAEKMSAATAASRIFFRRRRREHVSGWRDGGIRRLRGLVTVK